MSELQLTKEGSVGGSEFNYKLPRALRAWLKVRGFNSESQIHNLLAPSLRDLKNPYLLDQMSIAVDRLWRAFIHEEKIAVYADFDMDGTPGLSLFFRGLRDLGFENLTWYQPLRLKEGYGVHQAALQKLKDEGVQVLVTVDVGITSNEAIHWAMSNGIDVILTDHHLPGPELPSALAIINPNKGTCQSGLGHLCGAGVAFYLLMALKMRMTEKGACPKQFDLKNYLDDFAIATLSDMVPLIDENRVLIKHGLQQLLRTQRPGLRALLNELGLANQPQLSSQDITMKFVPKLNALSRLERGLRPIEIFLEENESNAKEKVSQVVAFNQTRRDLQQQALAQVEGQNLLQGPFVFDFSKDYHKGVIGLVANDLTQRFGWPSFIGFYDEAKQMIAGSARAPAGVHLVEALQFCSAALTGFGGHAMAAGFQLEPSAVDLFQQKLAEYFKGFQPQPIKLTADLTVELRELNDDLLKWFEQIEPFGKDFEAPLFKLESILIREMRMLKGGHLKFKIEQGRASCEAIYFSPPVDLFSKLNGEAGPLTLIVEMQRNFFRGQSRLQLLVHEVSEK